MKSGNILWVVLVFLLAGCSYIAKKKESIEYQQNELVRENNQAADIANQRGRSELISSNFPGALVAYDLSDVMLRRNQSIMGLPVRDQAQRVGLIIDEDPDAIEAELERVDWEVKLKIAQNKRQAQLELIGQRAEEVRNKGVVQKFWRWFTGLSFLAMLGILAALCFAFPVILPIAGRIIGWIVGKIPAAAGYIGAVSTSALDRVYKGIEKTKLEKGEDDETVKALRANLSSTMDQDQKDLITARRKAVPVPIDERTNPSIDPEPIGNRPSMAKGSDGRA